MSAARAPERGDREGYPQVNDVPIAAQLPFRRPCVRGAGGPGALLASLPQREQGDAWALPPRQLASPEMQSVLAWQMPAACPGDLDASSWDLATSRSRLTRRQESVPIQFMSGPTLIRLCPGPAATSTEWARVCTLTSDARRVCQDEANIRRSNNPQLPSGLAGCLRANCFLHGAGLRRGVCAGMIGTVTIRTLLPSCLDRGWTSGHNPDALSRRTPW